MLNNQIEFLEGNYSIINDYLKKCIFEFGYKKEEILVLVPTLDSAEDLFNKLDNILKPLCIITKEIVDNKIIITTFHSSKGLESRICILTNVDKINVDKIDNKKLLYVGMTRASQRLCIHAENYKNKTFARQLKNKEFKDNTLNIINHTLSEYLFPE